MNNRQKSEMLRAALVGFIGVDGKEQLTVMRASVVAMTDLGAPADDVKVSLEAIDALIATLPNE